MQHLSPQAIAEDDVADNDEDMMNFFKRKDKTTSWVMADEVNHPTVLESQSSDDGSLSKAEEAEGMLGEALQLAEKRTGSLLVLQKASRHQAVQLGRRVSSFSDGTDDASSIRSYNSKCTEPIFLKVPKGDPTILTQKSWDSVMGITSAVEGRAEEHPRCESNETTIRTKPLPNEADPAVFKPRTWDKLRSTIEAEEKNNRRFSFGSGLKKSFGKLRRPRRKSDELGEPNDTENIINTTAKSAPPVFVAKETKAVESSDETESPSLLDMENPRVPTKVERPELGEETPLESHPSFDDGAEQVEEAPVLKNKEIKPPESSNPEEDDSFEVVYTDGQGNYDILPPFPSRMVRGV
jgi:hypothetical protein